HAIANFSGDCLNETREVKVGFVKLVVVEIPDAPGLAIKCGKPGPRERGENEKSCKQFRRATQSVWTNISGVCAGKRIPCLLGAPLVIDRQDSEPAER